MSKEAGQTMVTNAINALASSGATRADLGMEMAKKILIDNYEGDTTKRNRVVIMFTDGSPTSGSSFEDGVANSAISNAKTMKSAGIQVYTVGVFEGANATVPMSDEASQENKYMHYTSSNFLNASSMSAPGTAQYPSNGSSYYLSASNSSDLNSIFQRIAEQIEAGGSDAKELDGETVIQDIIAPSFTLPDGADEDNIILSTYSYIGENEWAKNEDVMGAAATVSGDKVSVTGFNFSENWVGTVDNNGVTEYRGNKLVIKIPIVVKDGFLGGNNVPTNGAGSGVYASSDAATPIETFTSPTVNVPIAPITVTAPDKNVYLLGDLTADDLKTGASVMCGDVKIDLSKAEQNYGLDSWQNAYVTITPSFTPTDSNSLTGLTTDTNYTVGCTITPITKLEGDGVATEQEGSATGKINVFKPVMTFADSVVEYLSTHTFPTYFETTAEGNNYRDVVWKHGESTDSDVTMTGTAPTLLKEYDYKATDIDGTNTIIATADIPVNVTVKIDETDVSEYVTFIHVECEQDVQCGWDDLTDKPEFLLHVTNIVAELTITKKGLDVYAYAGTEDQEMAIFTVVVTTKSGKETYTIALADDKSATIKDVLVGTGYTITEQNGWTWRYGSSEVVKSNDTIVVGGTSVTITNKDPNPYWLGGDNYAVNVFGTGTTSSGAND